jgi:exodeoxyribonuclease VII large subunit
MSSQELFSSERPKKENREEKEKKENGKDMERDREEGSTAPISVLDFIAIVNDTLHDVEAAVVGEVSKVSFPPSGHVYFDLKDETGDGVLHCVVWKTTYGNLGIALEAGMRIVVLGSANVYAPRGDLSLLVRAMELTGEGVLKKRYEELRRKLAAEGVFSEERKRTIPEYPVRIGVVTSRNGAVIHDILNNLGRFGFKVLLADARVEGPEAVESLLAALRNLRAMPLDVLIVARGGGSMEALQAFDNEKLVRAIVAFPVPVIAAIGHHQDVPLAALAADVYVSTPTAAANLLNRSWIDATRRLERETERVASAYGGILQSADRALDPAYYTDRFLAMRSVVLRRMSYLGERAVSACDGLVRFARMRLETAGRIIAANDPARNLRLGYAIVRRHGKIVKRAEALPAGSNFNLQFSDGTVLAEVIDKNKKDGASR